MLHEIMHTMGLVANCGRTEHRAGHSSDDPRDLMWAGTGPWRPGVLDVNNDDYYRHGIPGARIWPAASFSTPPPGMPRCRRAGPLSAPDLCRARRLILVAAACRRPVPAGQDVTTLTADLLVVCLR